jgi:hypothetical protein
MKDPLEIREALLRRLKERQRHPAKSPRPPPEPTPGVRVWHLALLGVIAALVFALGVYAVISYYPL